MVDELRFFQDKVQAGKSSGMYYQILSMWEEILV